MARLALLAAAAALAAALVLGFERESENLAPKKAAEADCTSDELCLVSIF